MEEQENLLEKVKDYTLSVSEVAKLLNTSGWNVKVWARKGAGGIILDSMPVGERLKFSRKGVEAFLKAKQEQEQQRRDVNEKLAGGGAVGGQPVPRSGTTASKKKRASAARAKLA